MFTHENKRAHDSHRHSTPDNFVLESLGSADRLESTYVPLTTSSSSRPSISLPAPDFSLPPTIEQNANHFSLPVRRRPDLQIENRRVSLAAFGDLSSGASHLAGPTSGAWYSQEGYQQAVAQFQARRSRSQPPRPEPETSYSQHQSFQAPVTMRYATIFFCRMHSQLTKPIKCLRPNSTVSFSAFRTFKRFLLIFSILASSRYFCWQPCHTSFAD
jgi:hypothetical protein